MMCDSKFRCAAACYTVLQKWQLMPLEAGESEALKQHLREWREFTIQAYVEETCQEAGWPEGYALQKETFCWYLDACCPGLAEQPRGQLIHAFARFLLDGCPVVLADLEPWKVKIDELSEGVQAVWAAHSGKPNKDEDE